MSTRDVWKVFDDDAQRSPSSRNASSGSSASVAAELLAILIGRQADTLTEQLAHVPGAAEAAA